MKQQATQLLWGLYALIQGLVIMSRMYIAAHFPHQCILGLFLGNYLNSPMVFICLLLIFFFIFFVKPGISVARQIYGSPKWLNLKRNQFMIAASAILASALGTYWFLLLTGRDPAWSISQAFKWCARREYIHVDTTPFYSLTRYSGSAFGLGLGLTSR